MRMKTYSKAKKKSNESNHNARAAGVGNLDQMAVELEDLARKRLPDRVLQGVMAGHEDDIRQDAILLALGWYLRSESSPTGLPGHAWHPPRAIAGALRIARRDCIKALMKEQKALRELPHHQTGTTCHPVMIRKCDWPTPTMRTLVSTAIHVAHRTGKISASNATVALEVLVDGIQVAEVAKRCNVHRSNIYQHLTRVRRHIPTIIDRLEVSMRELE